jgi:hypothetical protein
MRDVPGDAASLPKPEGSNRLLAAGIDHRVDLPAPAPARDLVVFGAEPAARAEQGALHHRPCHPHAPADLLIRETFQLAQDDDLVVALAQASKCAAKVVELLAALERGMRRAHARFEPALRSIGLVAGVERNLLRAACSPELIDARVTRDLVDPRLKRDRPLGRSHAPQGRDEDLLADVFGPRMITEHPEDVGDNAPAIARVQLAKRSVVAASRRRDQTIVALDRCYLARS